MVSRRSMVLLQVPLDEKDSHWQPRRSSKLEERASAMLINSTEEAVSHSSSLRLTTLAEPALADDGDVDIPAL